MCLFLTVLFLSAGMAAGQTSGSATTYVRPDADQRIKWFVDDTVGPFALAGYAVGAGYSTYTNTPPEWGGKAKGFGKRLASNLGTNVIKNTAMYGLDEALKLDSHFYRSTKHDFGSRFGNAIISTFTARRSNGKLTVGVPRLVGTYTANIIANEVWYPARYSWKDGVRSGTVSLGINSVVNLVKEFLKK